MSLNPEPLLLQPLRPWLRRHLAFEARPGQFPGRTGLEGCGADLSKGAPGELAASRGKA